MPVLVDSDILIEVSRGKNAGIVAKWVALSTSSMAVLNSPISEAELWAGVRSNENEALEILFRTNKMCPNRQ